MRVSSNSQSILPNVDLVINCYEKTYRWVLTPEFIHKVKQQNNFRFENILITINNVKDRNHASKLAKLLVDQNVITRFFFVEDLLNKILEIVQLTKADLMPVIHYSDCALVGIYVASSKYLLYWDAEINLTHAKDWITPSLRVLEKDPTFFVATPTWTSNRQDLMKESCLETDEFYIGHGFSDQLFLVKRDDLIQPIYKMRHVYSMRFPMSHIAPIFETRVDSFMRRTGKYRIVYKGTQLLHKHEASSHPQGTRMQRLKKKLQTLVWILYSKHYDPCKKLREHSRVLTELE